MLPNMQHEDVRNDSSVRLISRGKRHLTEEWKAARGDVGCQGRPTTEKPNSGEGFSLQRPILAVVLRDENYQDTMEPIKLMLGDSSEITGHGQG